MNNIICVGSSTSTRPVSRRCDVPGALLTALMILLPCLEGHGQTSTARSQEVVPAWSGDGLANPPAVVSGEVLRQRPVQVRFRDLKDRQPSNALRFDLFDGDARRGTIDRRMQRRDDRYSLSGSIQSVSGGNFILAVNGDSIAGVIRLGALGTYRLQDDAAGGYVLQEIDATRLADCEVGQLDTRDLRAALKHASTTELGSCDDGSVIDVLVVFTTQARAEAGSLAAIEAQIDLMVEDANIAYVNSAINTSVNLVYAQEVVVDELTLSLGALTAPNDGVLDEVHDLREAYGADQVALIRSGGGGVANGLDTLDPAYGMDALAFCICGLSSAANSVFAHEIGHNLGCCHAIGDGGGCPAEGGLLYSFSNGHRFTGSSGTLWRTVMAYNPGTRIQHFSNPDIFFEGEATGIADTEPVGADNAQTINASAFFVSNHRCNDTICESLDLPSDAEDCDGNGLPDACEIALGQGDDCDMNGVLDACQLLDGTATDLNGDGVLDQCGDCNDNGQPDVIDIMLGLAEDCNRNNVPDLCEPDCDSNGSPDGCDLMFIVTSPIFSPFGDGIDSSFTVPAAPVAGDTIIFELQAFADLAQPDQTIDVLLNGFVVHTFFADAGDSCGTAPSIDTLYYDPSFFNFLVGLDPARNMALQLRPSASVNAAACGGGSWAGMSIRYRDAASPLDLDSNSVHDLCQNRGDVDGNGTVTITDLLALLSTWGPCGANCTGDVDLNGTVNVVDLLTLLANWG